MPEDKLLRHTQSFIPLNHFNISADRSIAVMLHRIGQGGTASSTMPLSAEENTEYQP